MSGARGKFNPFEMNWKDFEKQFNATHTGPQNSDLTWIEDYVKEMLAQVLPGGATQPPSVPSRMRPDVIDTHHCLIVRANVPERANLRKLKVFFHANRLRISGLSDEEVIVPLPALGRYEGSKAIFKDDVLEIRIPKELNETHQEISIQFL